MVDPEERYKVASPHLGADDHLHCAECSPALGIHCGYHCSLLLSEVIRVMGEQNVTQRQAEDVVLRRLRHEAVAGRAVR